jgi:hypothetical protein
LQILTKSPATKKQEQRPEGSFYCKIKIKVFDFWVLNTWQKERGSKKKKLRAAALAHCKGEGCARF